MGEANRQACAVYVLSFHPHEYANAYDDFNATLLEREMPWPSNAIRHVSSYLHTHNLYKVTRAKHKTRAFQRLVRLIMSMTALPPSAKAILASRCRSLVKDLSELWLAQGFLSRGHSRDYRKSPHFELCWTILFSTDDGAQVLTRWAVGGSDDDGDDDFIVVEGPESNSSLAGDLLPDDVGVRNDFLQIDIQNGITLAIPENADDNSKGVDSCDREEPKLLQGTSGHHHPLPGITLAIPENTDDDSEGVSSRDCVKQEMLQETSSHNSQPASQNCSAVYTRLLAPPLQIYLPLTHPRTLPFPFREKFQKLATLLVLHAGTWITHSIEPLMHPGPNVDFHRWHANICGLREAVGIRFQMLDSTGANGVLFMDISPGETERLTTLRHLVMRHFSRVLEDYPGLLQFRIMIIAEQSVLDAFPPLHRGVDPSPRLPAIFIRVQVDEFKVFSRRISGDALGPRVSSVEFFSWFASRTGHMGPLGPARLHFTFKDAIPIKHALVVRGDEDFFDSMKRGMALKIQHLAKQIPDAIEFNILVTVPGWSN